jgi:phosphoglycerate dehydrogenase-like enzyme
MGTLERMEVGGYTPARGVSIPVYDESALTWHRNRGSATWRAAVRDPEQGFVIMEFRSLVPRRVLIGAGTHEAFARAFRAALPDVEFRGNLHTAVTADDLEWADTYVGFKRPPLATMGAVKWVHCTGAGIDSWLYPSELPREILLTRTSEPFGWMIAEWALSRALAYVQRLRAVEVNQRLREWADPGISFLRGTTAVLVGTGDVGGHIGRALGALGVEVIGVSRTGRGDPAIFSAVHTIDALETVLPGADWLVLALPLTTSTRGLIDRRVLSTCRNVFLMNAGRGAVVDEAVIPEALDAGWLSGAALDVFEVEPLPPASPLWSDDRVMVSPHLSGPTTVDATLAGFLECLTCLQRGERPPLAVDRDREY